MIDPRLDTLKQFSQGYWAPRLAAQLEYGYELSRLAGGEYDDLLKAALDEVSKSETLETGPSSEAVRKAESVLTPLQETAKRYTMLCASHAHIDMNWMWRWDETVAITLETFRTMLNLMDEYPDFTYSQSQASVYRLVEKYDPEMLAAIQQRVKEGRWEVTAVTWVEADKNMPSGESMARHLLYTRRYLQELFDLPDAAFHMDYEPDTFGHSRNVPEILADAGVRHYYHCRGDQDEVLYRWEAPSGRSILVYREPTWYLGYIDPSMAVYVPGFCSKYGLDTMLKVYGVGDHGGGPTRRDLERLIDLDTWPVYPNIKFSTYREFFQHVEAVADQLPVKGEELNFIFTGCYTSQSRIKRANRLGESALFDAEALGAAAACQKNGSYPQDQFAEAWKNVLFNQFHDIIPGSGTIDTREHALAQFQETLAIANTQKMKAMRQLAGLVPPSGPGDGADKDAISEGAGVGFGVPDFRITQVSRGQGIKRIFQVFNPAVWERSGVAEITLWDWDGGLSHMAWQDANGEVLIHQLLDESWQNYWGHRYVRILVPVRVPACGFTTVQLDANPASGLELETHLSWRTERPDDLSLENECLSATFDPVTCALVSLVDKRSGEVLVSPDRPAGLRYILEDDRRGMTSWTVGRYMQVSSMQKKARLLSIEHGRLRQQLSFETALGDSLVQVIVGLDAGSRQLDYRLECDWLEVGRKEQGIPQLNFHLPLAFSANSYRYDVPFGVTDRPALALDVPGVSWASAVPDRGDQYSSVMLVSLAGYGFRGVDDSLALTLLRSSFDPDPYPELGKHTLRFAVRLVDTGAPGAETARAAFEILHPFEVLSGGLGSSNSASFLSLERDSLLVSGLKLPEADTSGSKLLVRLYEADGVEASASLQFGRPVRQAVFVDVHENPVVDGPQPQVDGQNVSFQVGPNRVCSLLVEFI